MERLENLVKFVYLVYYIGIFLIGILLITRNLEGDRFKADLIRAYTSIEHLAKKTDSKFVHHMALRMRRFTQYNCN